MTDKIEPEGEGPLTADEAAQLAEYEAMLPEWREMQRQVGIMAWAAWHREPRECRYERWCRRSARSMGITTDDLKRWRDKAMEAGGLSAPDGAGR